MIRVGIIGSTGYTGNELVRLLLQRPDVKIEWYGSHSYVGKRYADIYRNFFRLIDAECLDDNMAELADKVDVIFTATPQGLCASLVTEDILKKVKVVDLSADFRIKDVSVYEAWYGIEHNIPWTAHEWLAELIFYGIFRFVGEQGIYLFSMLAALLMVFAVWRGADSKYINKSVYSFKEMFQYYIDHQNIFLVLLLR